MIIKVKVQLKGEEQPHIHHALVFPDVMAPDDFITYRNAMTAAAKEIVSNPDVNGLLNDEAFYLIQLAEFITTSLDDIKKTQL